MKSVTVFSVALLVAMVMQSRADLDKEFCGKFAPDTTDDVAMEGSYLEDARMFMEKTTDGKTVDVEDITISKSDKKVLVKKYSHNKESDFYAILGDDKDLLIQNDFIAGHAANCTAKPLDGSSLANQYDIIDEKNKIVFQGMESMMSYTTKTPYKYVSKTTVRGIPAHKFFTCLWQKNTGYTLATFVYFSIDYVMPSTDIDVLLRTEANVIDPVTKKVTVETKDFFNVNDNLLLDFDLDRFDVPSNMYCKYRPEATPPDMPISFQFSTEMVDLGDPEQDPPATPKLQYHKETYSTIQKMFLDETETVGDSKMESFRKRVVHDFKTGLQYDMDMTVGSCSVHKIESDGVDYNTKDGVVSMKSPQQFFQLADYKYQYMGEHVHNDRGIHTEVYTTVVEGGTPDNPTAHEVTWHFASKNWKKDFGFEDFFNLPVRMIIIDNNADGIKENIVDFYQFTEALDYDQVFPDVSACFPQNKEIYVQMQTDADFLKVMVLGEGLFRAVFRETIQNQTGLVSDIRVSNLRIALGDGGVTVVKFTLLDSSDKLKVGDAAQQLMSEPSNDVIYSQLVKSVNSGKFAFVVDSLLLKVNVKATLIGKDYVNPESFDFRRQVANYSPGTFSGGAMGGLAVGMLLLGLVLGFGGFKGVKKVTQPVPDISMAHLQNT